MAEVKQLQRVEGRREMSISKIPSLILGIILILNLSIKAQAEFGSIVDIGAAGDFYLTDSSANNGQAYVNLLMQNTWSNSQLWIDVGAGGLVGETASSYIIVPQSYYRMGSKDKTNLTIGRALHDWSFADNYWNLSLTQPLFRWSEARPEQQGLVGVFFTTPIVKNNLEFTAFASPLFIPSQGPSYDLNNGNLSSSNPWFVEPVEVLNLSDQKVDLNFEVDVPKTQDVVFQESYGVQLATPFNKKGALFNMFAMDKPRNDLVLPFQGQLNLTTLEGDITIFPVVPHHQVGGVDLGWNFYRLKFVASYLYESEVEYDVPAGTFYPIIPEQHIYSATSLLRLTKTQRLWLGYLKVDRQANGLGGDNTGAQLTAFSARNRFEEAAQVKWNGLLWNKGGVYKINASLAYTQSLFKDNAWISSDVRWNFHKGIELYSQCDFFGGSEEQIEALDFISSYQNNDRCLLGGHYAF